MLQGQMSKLAPVTDTAVNAGGDPVGNRLFAVLYDELHRAASRELSLDASATLNPTTLLHETFLSFSVRESWELSDRPRFMAHAVRAMRGLIIDCLGRGPSQNDGGELEIVALPDQLPQGADGGLEIEKLREALDALTVIDARLAECVDLKYLCGFSFQEIAQLWNVSERTVQRDWDKARLLLYCLIAEVDSGQREKS